METETTGAGYTSWLRRVDAELGGVIGLTSRDLADRNWRDEFEAGYTPREAALEALDENGLDVELELDDGSEIAGAIDEASGVVTSDADPGL